MTDNSTVLTPESKCLDCGYKFDAATSAYGDRKPKAGDITMCINCGHLMAFREDFGVRPLTDAEIIDIAGDRRIVDAQRVRKFVMDKKNKT